MEIKTFVKTLIACSQKVCCDEVVLCQYSRRRVYVYGAVYAAGNTYIMVRPRNTTATEGSRVKLSCQAEAFPNNVTYDWLHDGRTVSPTGRKTVYADGSLVLASVDVEDAGWYTCRPTNGLGLTPEARAYLNVTCKLATSREIY